MPASDVEFDASLSSILTAITSLISAQKRSISEALRQSGRSRLARLVSSLPSSDSAKLETLALRDLPLAGAALGLAAASSSVNSAEEGAYRDACRSADVALVMLGVTAARPLQELIAILERQPGWRETSFREGDLLGVDAGVVVSVPTRLSDLCDDVDCRTFSVHEFGKYFREDRPVVIRNLAEDWPALTKWVKAPYLGNTYGHRVVPIEHTEKSTESMTEKFSSLGDVLRLMLRSTPSAEAGSVYLAQHPLLDYIPELENDIMQPAYMDVVGKHRADLTNVWMGSAGTGSKLHFDSADNILVQVVGRKTLVLVSPQQSELLYQVSPADNFSPVNVENPDLVAHPLFESVSAVQIELGPGDAVYIPAQHWHWVKAITSSISVNFWF